jgi:uncharacterized protein (TIGR02328 family)
MRLWHQSLISKLPRQQLLGQHRECCALRGRGWGRNHSVVNYVFTYSPNRLIAYHHLIMEEMEHRGYHPDPTWYNVDWRGTQLKEEKGWGDEFEVNEIKSFCRDGSAMIFPEHNNEYLQECIENLKEKGIDI